MPVPARTAPARKAPEADELAETIKEAVTEAIAAREAQKAAEERVRVGKSYGSSVLLAVVLVMFAGSCLYNLIEMRDLRRPIDSSVQRRIEAMDVHLYAIRGQIEEYRAEHNHLPPSLAALDLPVDDNLEYIPISKKEYELQYTVDRVVCSYNSKEPPEKLLTGEFARVVFRRDKAEVQD